MPSPPLHRRAAVALLPSPASTGHRRRATLTILPAGAGPGGPLDHAPGRGEDHTTMCDLRVMTFNIRGAYHRDGEKAWPHRAALNVATIERHAPDLIGFQELQRGNEEIYEARLRGYHHELGPRAEFGEPHNYNAIYWRPERLEPVAAGGFWLSETPDQYSASWDTACLRAANWVRFRCREDGAEFLHLNTHLDHVSEPARVEGSKLVLRQLDELAGDRLPVILTADFNCNPESNAYRLYRDGGFV